MILQRLKIENFKCLRDVDIQFPSIGIIGVVGTNGAGKSTLFEAMLWALFRPNAIGTDNRDVVPRRSAGLTTTVELTVETNDNVYTITRSLRITAGGSQRVEASIFRGDDQEPLVTGANPVSDYIRTTLLRMSPQSFTTTFFTRQKELAFFGEVGDTERRKEMQRLLDLDAIERAQTKLREERTRERHTLAARSSQLADESDARDLDADLRLARGVEEDATAAVAHLKADFDTRSAAYETVAARLESLRAVQRQFDHRASERRAAETTKSAAEATRDDALQRIGALHARAKRAAVIVPLLASLDATNDALAAAEAAAVHAQRVAESARDLRESENQSAQLAAAADATIADLDALRELLFDWDTLDHEPPGAERARMVAAKLTAAAPLAIERVKERDHMRVLIRVAEDAGRAAEEAKHRANKRAELDARLAVVIAGGDPVSRVAELERQERALTEDVTRQETELAALRAEHAKYATLRKRWEAAEPDADCPTCGRPFSEDDAEITLASLRRSMDACMLEGKKVNARLEETRTAGRATSGTLQTERERLRQAETITAQRDRAVAEEREAAARAARADEQLRAALSAAGRRKPPTEQDVRSLEKELSLLERAANAGGPANRLATQLDQITRRITTQRDALAVLGPPTYDATRHEELRQERMRLAALQTEATRISEELIALPAEEVRRDEAARKIAECDTVIARIGSEQAALGYNPNAVTQVETEAVAAAEVANQVQSALADARVAVANAHNGVERIEAEQTRLAVLRADVDRLGASVARYNLMDDGFTDFSVSLAARIQPKLGEYASDLIERMSNGRYNRLAFDTNYTPALYDGDLEKFPVEKFSGGERDIAALAARIALSQLLAARGGHEIGFMVLDEVFGSLDTERRTLVLEALAAMGDIVPQLFIISHVDDVRMSPLMNEVWTMAAQPDGTSALLRRDAADFLLGASAFAAM
ncbi:MAG: SMC family ATPase [Chloroflexota bacterium]|nr:SMC family ATPase [Chloroflexota bacterium]